MYLLGIMASWAIMVPKLGLQDYQQMIIMICNLLNPFRTKPKYTQDGVYRKSMFKAKSNHLQWINAFETGLKPISCIKQLIQSKTEFTTHFFICGT